MSSYGNGLSLRILQTMTMTRVCWLVSLAKTTKGADSLDFCYSLMKTCSLSCALGSCSHH